MDKQERIFRYLAACPPAISGSGGHNQTFALACSLYNGFALSEAETLEYLKMYNSRCRPEWSEAELAHKAQQAALAQHTKPRGHLFGGNGSFSKEDFKGTSFPAKPQPKPAAPPIDPATAIEVFLKGFSCTEADIYDASPVKPSGDFTQDGILLVHHLFQPGELVNFVTDYRITETKIGTKPVPQGYGETIERGELIDLWGLGMPASDAGGWMRMNPMDGQGIADKNVTSHRYILLEFDSIPTDLQLSLFARLPLPIACILTSGGKSLHAWVKADSADATCYRDDVTMLLKLLARFGIDGKNKNPSRLSRLPGVTRKLGATGDGRQRLLFLNPRPQQTRILP